MDELKGDDKEELIELLDCHFDPEKQAVFPLVKKHRSKRGGKCRAILFSNIVTILKRFFFFQIFAFKGHKENTKPKQNTPASPDSTNKSSKRGGRNRRRVSSNKNESFNGGGGGGSSNVGSGNAAVHNKVPLTNSNNKVKDNIFSGHAVVTNPPIASH